MKKRTYHYEYENDNTVAQGELKARTLAKAMERVQRILAAKTAEGAQIQSCTVAEVE